MHTHTHTTMYVCLSVLPGYSPDCSVPSMLPVGNTVLQPGATIAVEVPSVPQLADSLTLSFQYVEYESS